MDRDRRFEDGTTLYARTRHQQPQLYVITDKGTGEYPLAGKQVLGRRVSGHDPDISVQAAIVSRRHGQFTTAGGRCLYQDVGSSNGTIYRGRKLAPGAIIELRDGDVLRIRAKNLTGPSRDIVIVYMTEYAQGTSWRRIRLGNDIRSLDVGRSEDLALQDRTVSRRHASFFHAENGWAIIDNRSKNGVLLNGDRVRRPMLLQPMDVVQIAGHLFVFQGAFLLFQADAEEAGKWDQAGGWGSVRDIEPGRQPGPAVRDRVPGKQPGPGGRGKTLSIHIEERNVWNRLRRKTLLRDIDLRIDSGSLVLILGGSGAGKTTFMNAVMGYEPARGIIEYGDSDIYREYEKMKYEIGYVPQQDLLRMEDVVYDTLDNAARMRLPDHISAAERADRVEKALHMFGLSREKDSLVGKLSGGQRKRLSIAVEYIGNPSLFFLDEPDSGLDGIMARELMGNLRQIADQGKIVMVISHAPDRAFDLFDRVIVLAKSAADDSGHLVFFGHPAEACRFFDTDSLEGIVGRINRRDEGGQGLADYYIDKYKRSGRR